jgi:signal transduction histidine kinase
VQQTVNTRQPEIKIDAKQTGNRIAITMLDNGIGIAQEKLPRIFDPFFTTHDVGGNSMGLGLSICHAIVGKLGGTIHIDSLPEQWTKVSLDLQAADQGNKS